MVDAIMRENVHDQGSEDDQDVLLGGGHAPIFLSPRDEEWRMMEMDQKQGLKRQEGHSNWILI
jgi:alkaline phosphatase